MTRLEEVTRGSYSDFLQHCKNILNSKGFVFVQDVAETVSLGLYSGRNVILWGPAGHGKSEMVEAVLEGLGLLSRDPITKMHKDDNSVFIQSFGEGTNEDALWGGIDIAALDSEKKITYCPENSFLNKEIAVFEELFDAPPMCLLPLKHVLTQGVLAKGSDQFLMKTRCVIACTNKSPEDLKDLGPSYTALTERFPLQRKIQWKSYGSESYMTMFSNSKFAQYFPGETMQALADSVSNTQASGVFVSPRTAMYTFMLLANIAQKEGRTVSTEDFAALKSIPGLESMAETIQASIDRARGESQADTALRSVQQEFNNLVKDYDGLINSGKRAPLGFLKLAKRFKQMSANISGLPYNERTVASRDQMVAKCSEYENSARTSAENVLVI